MTPRQTTAARRGFTLLELILAMGLTILVLSAVGMAVDFYLRGIQSARKNVEEAQLARALLQRIADDIRAAVRYDPVQNGDILTDSDMGSLAPTVDDGTQTGDAESANEEDSTQSEPTGVPQKTPGLYGNRQQIQIDVSRLPRFDQYRLDGMPQTDRVSDVKTVTYFVGSPTMAAPDRRGLLRGQFDRAVTVYAEREGTLEALADQFVAIAPEVALIEFEYFDGGQWVDSWDTAELQSLPVAVRVSIAMVPAGVSPDELRELPLEELSVYSVVVQLMASDPQVNQEAASEDSAGSSSDGKTTDSGDSSDDSAKTSEADKSQDKKSQDKKSQGKKNEGKKGEGKREKTLSEKDIPQDLKDRAKQLDINAIRQQLQQGGKQPNLDDLRQQLQQGGQQPNFDGLRQRMQQRGMQ